LCLLSSPNSPKLKTFRTNRRKEFALFASQPKKTRERREGDGREMWGEIAPGAVTPGAKAWVFCIH
jgi:hypothetical protein